MFAAFCSISLREYEGLGMKFIHVISCVVMGMAVGKLDRSWGGKSRWQDFTNILSELGHLQTIRAFLSQSQQHAYDQ